MYITCTSPSAAAVYITYICIGTCGTCALATLVCELARRPRIANRARLTQWPLSMSSSSSRTDLNVSRRLRRMLRPSGLPRVGAAHSLRMRYVQVTHVRLVLHGNCTHESIVKAMHELLEGWSPAEEQHSEVGGYHHRLLNVIDDIQTEIAAMVMGEWQGASARTKTLSVFIVFLLARCCVQLMMLM